VLEGVGVNGVSDGVSVNVGSGVLDGTGVAVKRGVMLTIGRSVSVGTLAICCSCGVAVHAETRIAPIISVPINLGVFNGLIFKGIVKALCGIQDGINNRLSAK